jgi:pyruvate/2-oxoglutarate dehydrogenase complex dihydrolipoamide dehydrogenase (E3) component
VEARLVGGECPCWGWIDREALEATEVPGALVASVAGPSARNFSKILPDFGARVTVVEGSGRLPLPEEPEAGALRTPGCRSGGCAR